jgi:hypothetical protein
VFLHTSRPPIWTTSVYWSPRTDEPSPKPSVNVCPRSCAVELAFGTYTSCLNNSIHTLKRAGRDRYCQYQSPLYISIVKQWLWPSSARNVVPVKETGGVPTEMVPYHNCSSLSVKGSLPVSRLCGLLTLPERGCATPVFLSNAIRPLLIFL